MSSRIDQTPVPTEDLTVRVPSTASASSGADPTVHIPAVSGRAPVAGTVPSSRQLPPDPWREALFESGEPTEDLGLRRRGQLLAWLLPALAAGVVAAWGIGRAGLWTDELATAGMAGTPWPRFWPVLRGVDAVLAPYYVLEHLWVSLAGDSDVALRLPSWAAMVATAALIGRLGYRLAGFRAGLTAGLIFAVVPGVSRYGQEARPYALVTLLAVVATAALVAALDRPTRWRWAGYGFALVGLGLLHIVALLLITAHAWLVFAWKRPMTVRWSVTAAAALALLTPLFWYGTRQRHQVAHIAPVGLTDSGTVMAALFGSLAVGLALVALALYALPLRWPSAVHTTWALVPVAVLAAVSLGMPLLLARYLVFTLPAWALLAGAALARLRPAWIVAGIVVITALGVPAQLAARQPAGHGEATRGAAAVVATGDRPGDAIVYADGDPMGPWTARDAIDRYVPADRRPADVLATRPPRTDGQLLAGECPEVSRCLGHPARVWVVRVGEWSDPLRGLGPAKERVLRARYRVAEVWHLRQMTVAVLTARPAGR